MKKTWKVKNVSNKQVKITVAISSCGAPGVILQPGEFCIGLVQKTSPMDAQLKRKLITIEEFDNSNYKLTMAKAYNETALDKAVKKTEIFTNK